MIQKVIKITIDPTLLADASLNHVEMEAVNHFFQSPQSLWNKNHEYGYVYKNRSYLFCFTHSILRRQRSNGKEGVRYEIFNTHCAELGSGGFSIVYPIIGSIKFEVGKVVLKNGINRIVKVENNVSEKRKKLINKEYASLSWVNHLGAKPPVFIGNDRASTSYLVMRQAPGITLEELLYSERDWGELTIVQRVELSFAILTAVKTQVVDKDLIHRDLKPNNMLVDMNQWPPKVTIVDYGCAIHVHDIDKRRVGTASYRSPEAYVPSEKYTQKSDSYSVGRILSYLWGDDSNNYYMDPYSSWKEILEKSTNKALFSRPRVNLFQKDQEIIRNCINNLMAQEPSNRSTMIEAIDQLATIDCRKYEMEAIKKSTQWQIDRFEASLDRGVKNIKVLLKKLYKKEKDLFQRGFHDEAQVIKKLHQRLSEHTQLFECTFDPVMIAGYQSKCFDELNKAKTTLQNHRDSNWILAEIGMAITLLGVGYLFCVGVNYLATGRLGLFSQTQSDRIADNLKHSISHLSP